MICLFYAERKGTLTGQSGWLALTHCETKKQLLLTGIDIGFMQILPHAPGWPNSNTKRLSQHWRSVWSLNKHCAHHYRLQRMAEAECISALAAELRCAICLSLAKPPLARLRCCHSFCR